MCGGVHPQIVGGKWDALEEPSVFAFFFGDCKKEVPLKATKHLKKRLNLNSRFSNLGPQ